ncbi:pstB domain protein [Mycobacterium xenopi 4042]|uniref:PstB domain protein n=1 Tax=Mycobacterium xenopi 4042 TaxID=1299334 RepID=X8DCE4_MYCXE|nr:pstB domain protein [Mycobacterium xenopi 4042]
MHNDTLEHQHLALSDIHRATGHEQLFDTLFVYENYPIDTAALSAPTGWPSPSSPPANTTTTRCPWWPCPAASWCFASNSTPRCSMRPASRRSPSGCGGCWWR